MSEMPDIEISRKAAAVSAVARDQAVALQVKAEAELIQERRKVRECEIKLRYLESLYESLVEKLVERKTCERE